MKEKPIYSVVENFTDLLSKLIELNGEKFAHIDPKMLRMVVITNKEPKDPFWRIRKINNPVALFTPIRYVIVSYSDFWDACTEDQKALVLLNILLSLDPDEDEPAIIPFDLKDHADMIRTFGVDYLNNSAISGLFDKPVEWKQGIPSDEK